MRNVPKLRFKEFQEKWKRKSIDDVSIIVGGATPLKSNTSYWNGTIPWVSSQEVGSRYLIGTTHNITEKAVSETNVREVPINSILMVSRSGILKRTIPFSLVKKKMTINQDVKAIMPVDSQVDNLFMYQWLKGNEKGLLGKTVKGGTTVQSVSMDLFKQYPIYVPSLKEQLKIAIFLNLIDDKIEVQQEKIKLLKEQKKGYMQKIFNRELRFKDEHGKTFPESREYNFANFLEIPLKEKEENPIKENLLTVKLHLKGIAVSENIATLKIGSTTYYKRKAGQFIYGKQNLFNGAFGIVPEELDGFLSSGDIPTLDFKKEFIEPLYFYYYLSQWNVYKRMENVSTGTGSKRIHEGELLKQKMRLPCLDEQKQIVNFLKTFEKKILLEEERLKEIEKQKQGFMQQMFV